MLDIDPNSRPNAKTLLSIFEDNDTHNIHTPVDHGNNLFESTAGKNNHKDIDCAAVECNDQVNSSAVRSIQEMKEFTILIPDAVDVSISDWKMFL